MSLLSALHGVTERTPEATMDRTKDDTFLSTEVPASASENVKTLGAPLRISGEPKNANWSTPLRFVILLLLKPFAAITT